MRNRDATIIGETYSIGRPKYENLKLREKEEQNRAAGQSHAGPVLRRFSG